ncbi:MAG TPA: hypothetical protein VGH76_23935 [Actinomycetospora sp.]|uniref:hypothetical protein n=1 Tax=Actinomycetospora sp. TaxID=1872135 RepID=UPI002F4125F1
MPAWIWFVVALVAAAGGALLLWYDRARPSRRGNGRRDWAAAKGWEFTDALSSPPHAWRYGTLRGEGPRAAYDVATGAVPGPGGRRLGCIFDQEQDGVTVATVAAVRGTIAVPVAIELRLPESPRPDDDELDNLGQVGRRYAFVSNALEGRKLLTRQVTDAADRVGADVPLVWAEDTWVLASIEPEAAPDRVEGLIESLVDVSAAIKEAVEGGGSPGSGAAGSPADEAPTAVVAGRAREGPAVDEAPTTTGRGTREDEAPTTTVPRATDEAPTTTLGGRGPGRGAGRTAGARDEDEDLEYDEELERFASGDEDSGPFTRGGSEPTHRDRPGDIPYDLEQDDPGSDAPSEGPRSSKGATWRSGPFRGR